MANLSRRLDGALSWLMRRGVILRTAQITVVFVLFNIAFITITESLYVSDFTWFDGILQMWNPVRRLDSGLPYVYFHGAAIPALMLPFYTLLGEGFLGANAAYRVLIALAFIAPLFAVGFAGLRGGRQRMLYFGLVLGVFFFVTPFVYNASLFVVSSPLGIRTLMPLMALAVLIIPSRRWWKPALFGATLPLALLLGTEHGLGLILATVFTFGGAFVLRWRAAREHLTFIVFTAIGAAASLLTVTFGIFGGFQGLIGALRYNLSEITADQVWYFSVPPNNFLRSWVEILDPGVLVFTALTVIILLIFVRRWLRDKSATLYEAGGVLVVLYSFIVLGTYLLSYISLRLLSPQVRVAVITLALLIVPAAIEHRALIRARVLRYKWGVLAGVAVLVVVNFTGALTNLLMPAYEGTQVARYFQTGARVEPKISEYMAQTTAYFDAVGGLDDDTTLWAFYAGMLHDHYGVFNPAQDYIIHALGKTRRAEYAEGFRTLQPDYVETLRRANFPYEMWMQNEHWDFYEPLLLNYSVDLVTGHSIIWRRTAAEWRDTPTDCALFTLEAGAESFTLPESYRIREGHQVITAQVNYSISNPWKSLPIIGNAPRYLIELDGVVGIYYSRLANREIQHTEVSLPPYYETWAFPLILQPDTLPTLTFATYSLLPGASYRVESVCLRAVDVGGDTLAELVRLELDDAE